MPTLTRSTAIFFLLLFSFAVGGCVLPFQRRSVQAPREAAVPASSSATMRGTVNERLSDGRVAPLAGVTVRSSAGTSAVSDAEGRFTLRLAKGREQEVSLSLPGYTFEDTPFFVKPTYDDESRPRLYGSKRGQVARLSPTTPSNIPTPTFVNQRMGVIKGKILFDPGLGGDPAVVSDNQIRVRDVETKRVTRTLPVRWNGEFSLSGPVGRTYLIEVAPKDGVVFIPERQTVQIKEGDQLVEISARPGR